MKEKTIDGYENYVVSSDGVVINTDSGNILKPLLKKTGYYEVCLTDKNHRHRWFLVHRLVAEAFCEKKNDDTEVNHIDGDKTNNNCSNLEWVSHSENLKHAFDKGLRNQDVSARKVIATNMKTGCETIFSSIYKAARTLGISQGNICLCCQGKRPYASGFYWRYL